MLELLTKQGSRVAAVLIAKQKQRQQNSLKRFCLGFFLVFFCFFLKKKKNPPTLKRAKVRNILFAFYDKYGRCVPREKKGKTFLLWIF